MHKAMINWLLIVFSILSIIIGVLKLFIGFDNFTISIGSNYVTIPNSTSVLYVFLVNLIGGVSVFYHSLKTITYKNKINHTNPVKLSKLEIISGVYSMLIALIMMIKLFVLLAGFGNNFVSYFIIFLIVIGIQGVYPILIIALVFKNLKN